MTSRLKFNPQVGELYTIGEGFEHTEPGEVGDIVMCLDTSWRYQRQPGFEAYNFREAKTVFYYDKEIDWSKTPDRTHSDN